MTPAPPAALALLAAFCCLSCSAFPREPPTWFEGVFLSSMCPLDDGTTLYGIMLDAGSTGTRIHVYTFAHRRPEQPPELEGEIFDSVKPGLSAFADEPKQVIKARKENPEGQKGENCSLETHLQLFFLCLRPRRPRKRVLEVKRRKSHGRNLQFRLLGGLRGLRAKEKFALKGKPISCFLSLTWVFKA
ncbi:ectonucleoside triphosphate diphosphohydrolase 5-like [Tachyglossus aculeatus]|uniref:ectonucleoside triphosphate diphosphohydrolase 5-like n=1 Tax=Tachyglossus aculeatus TaxID=9261 RepID=UPI0018F5D4C4|nr:ectonucleoside triphosphate diphosphohydrolase 5-like [Tachyglossus aculeatus]